VGIFASKYNHSINSAVQLLAHCKFMREVVLAMRMNEKNKVLCALQAMVQAIETAQYRAVHSDVPVR
jgi:hypothetical protein